MPTTATEQVYGYRAASVETFGGLYTNTDPTNLPPYLSPDCQDVEFLSGLVRTRPGLTSLGIRYATDVSINYLRDYTNDQLETTLLALTSTGVLTNGDTGAALASNIAPNARGQSVTSFGREYIAFSDGVVGIDNPRQWDGTNLDRVSQDGPAEGPTVTDYLPAAAVVQNPGIATAVGIAAASPTNYITYNYEWIDDSSGFPVGVFETVTFPTALYIQTTAPITLSVGDVVSVAGVIDPSYNGTYVIATVISTTEFTLDIFYSDIAASSGGTLTFQQQNVSIIRANNSVLVNTSIAHTFLPGMTVVIGGIPGVSLGGGITAITRVSGLVTVTTAAAHKLVVGSTVVLTGVVDTTFNVQVVVQTIPSTTTFTFDQAGADAASAGGVVNDQFNGSFTIVSVPSTTTFTYNQVGPNDSSTSAGTAVIQGNIEAGLHQVATVFVTRSGYRTQPSPPTLFNAGGGKLAAVDNIIIANGVPNVIARLLIFTPVLDPSAALLPISSSFYTIVEKMNVPDNTTTAKIVDFSDQQLLSGENVDDLFDEITLQEAAGVLNTQERLLWWGVRNNISTFLNMSFDGGWNLTPDVTSDYPKGWMLDVTNGAGGLRTDSGIWGSDYSIIGNGATATRGLITQNAVKDVYGTPKIEANKEYSVRVRVRKYLNTVIPAGTLHVDLYSVTDGIDTVGLAVTAAQVNAQADHEYYEYTGALTDSALTTIPDDLVIRVFVNGTPAAGTGFQIEDIEVYPTNEPYDLSTLFVSKSEEPENYNGVTGLVVVNSGDGQAIKSVRIIRDYIYIYKDQAIYVTTDNGGDPATWTVNEVSKTVGTDSVRGVGVGDEWHVVAEQNGVYLMGGSQPEKISQEIQPTWDTINWDASETLDTLIDVERRRIYIAAPTGVAIVPNTLFVLDYLGGFADPMETKGAGRKWTTWTIPCNSMAIRHDHSLIFGNNVDNGYIYQLDTDALTDAGTKIDDYWQSGYVANPLRLLWGYLSANISGTGCVELQGFKGGQSAPVPLRGWALTETATTNRERQVRVQSERVSYKVASNAVGHRFSIQGLYLWLTQNAPSPIRGRN